MNSKLSFLGFCEMVNVRLSPAQRGLCAVAFDGAEPRDIDPELARILFGEVQTIPPSARAVLVAVVGARSGKSYILGALYSLWRALVADLSSLAPGEQATALIVAPDIRLGRQTLRYASGAAKASSAIARLVEADTGDALVIRRPDSNAVAIECLPATRGGSALRGRSLVSAVLDESAFFRDEQFQVNDTDLFKAVAPRVLPGGLVVICSTPWAELGLLYDEFMRNADAPVTALACRAPTVLMRSDDPRILSMVAREVERDPINAEREFGAMFLSGGAGLFFSAEAVHGSVYPKLMPAREPPAGAIVAFGSDLALARDSAALIGIHNVGPCFDVAEMIELRPQRGKPLRLSEVIQTFSNTAAHHGCSSIMVDHHEYYASLEHLPPGMLLVPVAGGQQGKIETHIRARDLLHGGHVRIPQQYSKLAQQLREVMSKPTPGGGLQISSPRRGGAHGDLASAFVLALAASYDDGSKLFSHHNMARLLQRSELFARQ